MCMRKVSGVGGSSIKAVGIGEVRVRVGKGRHFILKDVFTVPRPQSPSYLSASSATTDMMRRLVIRWPWLQARNRASQAMASSSQARPDRWLHLALASGSNFSEPSQAIKPGLQLAPANA
ncbi:hypothetical protein B0H17DRAFT_1135534 [Mycena rosella]|uniref:Uncharacterized protein n=1 Tax=Mycena rosella TaxID=1033263 RepID=A0AAD7DDB2_MYCRO|nr:hypothetical protein B0H17DRAFT_1135534 [Mycena rosella]